MNRSKMLAMAAALAGGLGFAAAANAAPLPSAPLAAGPVAETVAFGCGPGWVPNAYGVCRPRPFYGRPFYARPVVVVRPFYRPRPWRRW